MAHLELPVQIQVSEKNLEVFHLKETVQGKDF